MNGKEGRQLESGVKSEEGEWVGGLREVISPSSSSSLGQLMDPIEHQDYLGVTIPRDHHVGGDGVERIHSGSTLLSEVSSSPRKVS